MSYFGQVKNGVVVLEEGTTLAEGTRVRIEPLASEPTLADRLQRVIGMAEGLPPDLAENHGHYLYRRPKK